MDGVGFDGRGGLPARRERALFAIRRRILSRHDLWQGECGKRPV